MQLTFHDSAVKKSQCAVKVSLVVMEGEKVSHLIQHRNCSKLSILHTNCIKIVVYHY